MPEHQASAVERLRCLAIDPQTAAAGLQLPGQQLQGGGLAGAQAIYQLHQAGGGLPVPAGQQRARLRV